MLVVEMNRKQGIPTYPTSKLLWMRPEGTLIVSIEDSSSQTFLEVSVLAIVLSQIEPRRNFIVGKRWLDFITFFVFTANIFEATEQHR